MNLYLETSVFGGYFDPEFQKWSRLLFQRLSSGEFGVLVSTALLDELDPAPAQVQSLMELIPADQRIFVPASREVIELRNAYLAANIVPGKYMLDAEHIAYASVARAAAIVSWNFKHIVNFGRISGYHAVNEQYGYPALQIITPMEIVGNEQPD